MIALRKETSVDPLNAEQLEVLPRYVRSAIGVYWHLPRSAARWPDRISVSCWCGVGLGTRGVVFSDEDPGVNVCGTCVGRHAGAEREAGLIFAPRDDFRLPRWCPGESDPATHHRTCIACGVATRWWRGTYSWHRPAPELVERCGPCPDHGWRDARARDCRIVCFAWVGGGWGACDFDMGPRG